MDLIFPENINDWYVKGTIQDQFNQEVYIEIPGIFNEDGTCNIEQTQEKVNTTINMINITSAHIQQMAANNISKATL